MQPNAQRHRAAVTHTHTHLDERRLATAWGAHDHDDVGSGHQGRPVHHGDVVPAVADVKLSLDRLVRPPDFGNAKRLWVMGGCRQRRSAGLSGVALWRETLGYQRIA